MQKVLFTLMSLFLVTFAFGQKNTKTETETKAPDITFEEKVIDFGSVEDGVKQKVVFKFYNSGTAPLVIKSVKPSCGCTAGSYTQEPVMPGESGEIEASFNSSGFGGRNITKSLTVTTNINNNGVDQTIILSFKGMVKPKGEK